MTDPTDPTDPTDDPEIVPDAPIPADEPSNDVIEPTVTVMKQGDWRIIQQQQAKGYAASICLNPEQAQAVGWALLSPDEATSDTAAPVDPNAPSVGGRFT